MFDFEVKYPSGQLFIASKAPRAEVVRVLVEASDRKRMRSNRNLDDRYKLVETRGRFTVYQASYQSRGSIENYETQ